MKTILFQNLGKADTFFRQKESTCSTDRQKTFHSVSLKFSENLTV